MQIGINKYVKIKHGYPDNYRVGETGWVIGQKGELWVVALNSDWANPLDIAPKYLEVVEEGEPVAHVHGEPAHVPGDTETAETPAAEGEQDPDEVDGGKKSRRRRKKKSKKSRRKSRKRRRRKGGMNGADTAKEEIDAAKKDIEDYKNKIDEIDKNVNRNKRSLEQLEEGKDMSKITDLEKENADLKYQRIGLVGKKFSVKRNMEKMEKMARRRRKKTLEEVLEETAALEAEKMKNMYKKQKSGSLRTSDALERSRETNRRWNLQETEATAARELQETKAAAVREDMVGDPSALARYLTGDGALVGKTKPFLESLDPRKPKKRVNFAGSRRRSRKGGKRKKSRAKRRRRTRR